MSDRCARCNRRITNPESVIYGMGPVCFTRFTDSAQGSLFDEVKPVIEPYQQFGGSVADQITELVVLLKAARAKLTDEKLCKKIDNFFNQ